jgi:phenylpropionate dioxygenase-like ring-hydroxylating dioxygenase large terminal subunit
MDGTRAPLEQEADFLRDLWYFAVPGTRLARGRMTAKTMLGEPLLIGRDQAGEVFALRDLCPHRGIPLTCGSFDGREVECCYHGWRFSPDGRCTLIPSLVEDQTLDLSKIRVKSYPAREVQGNVWVFFGRDAEGAPEIPLVPAVGERRGDIAETMLFGAAMDHSVIGLMDPAHGPFVHRSWWWRSKKSIHAKQKPFAPSPWGFTMVRHAPSSNSRAYRLLGGAPETEIVFRLPGVRIEHVQAGRHHLCNLTAVTPIDEKTTEINHVVWWSMPWLTFLKPALRPFARLFLRQDRDIMEKQSRGLKHEPPLLLIDDADRQAKWYYRLKNEYARSRAEGRPFVNPVKERTLKWRS